MLQQSPAFKELPRVFVTFFDVACRASQNNIRDIIRGYFTAQRKSMIDMIGILAFAKFYRTIVATSFLPLIQILYLLCCVRTCNLFFASTSLMPIHAQCRLAFFSLQIGFTPLLTSWSYIIFTISLPVLIKVKQAILSIFCIATYLTKRVQVTTFKFFIKVKVLLSSKFNFFAFRTPLISIWNNIRRMFSICGIEAFFTRISQPTVMRLFWPATSKVFGGGRKNTLASGATFTTIWNGWKRIDTTLLLPFIVTNLTHAIQDICMSFVGRKEVQSSRFPQLTSCALLQGRVLGYNIHDASPIQMYPCLGVRPTPLRQHNILPLNYSINPLHKQDYREMVYA